MESNVNMKVYDENNYFIMDLADVGITADNWSFDIPMENCKIVGEPSLEIDEEKGAARFILNNMKLFNAKTNEIIFEWSAEKEGGE